MFVSAIASYVVLLAAAIVAEPSCLAALEATPSCDRTDRYFRVLVATMAVTLAVAALAGPRRFTTTCLLSVGVAIVVNSGAILTI